MKIFIKKLLKKQNSKSVHNDYSTIINGFNEFIKTGNTPHSAYLAMRKLFVATKGESNRRISSLVDNIKLPIKDWEKGVLGLTSDVDLKLALDEMLINGYYVFPKKLDNLIIEALVDFSKNTPCTWCSNFEDKTSSLFLYSDAIKPKLIQGPRCDFEQREMVKSRELMELVFDSSILNFAQEYLGCMPRLDLLAMWWSFPYKNQLKSEAAQMYHFDLDRLKFIKFFFYLTDVDESNGPHCYVKGSHNVWNNKINRDGRFTDDEIQTAFGKDNIVEIIGKKGTIIAVDTIGLHKGKDLIDGSRLLCQIEFANSLFGQNYSKPDIKEKSISEFKGYADNKNSFKDFFNIID